MTSLTWNQTDDTNELVYKTEIDSQAQKTNTAIKRAAGWGDKLGVWNQQIHTSIYKIDK